MIWAGEEHGALGVFHIKIEEKKNKEQYKYLKLAVFKEKDQSEIGQLLCCCCFILGQNLRLKAKQLSCL